MINSTVLYQFVPYLLYHQPYQLECQNYCGDTSNSTPVLAITVKFSKVAFTYIW